MDSSCPSWLPSAVAVVVEAAVVGAAMTVAVRAAVATRPRQAGERRDAGNGCETWTGSDRNLAGLDVLVVVVAAAVVVVLAAGQLVAAVSCAAAVVAVEHDVDCEACFVAGAVAAAAVFVAAFVVVVVAAAAGRRQRRSTGLRPTRRSLCRKRNYFLSLSDDHRLQTRKAFSTRAAEAVAAVSRCYRCSLDLAVWGRCVSVQAD